MEFAESDLLPSRIFLCGGGSALPGIREALLSDEWTKTLPFSKKPQVSYLQPEDIIRISDATGELNNPQDITPIGLANLALLDHIEEEKMLSSILRKSMQAIDKN
jgi:cell division protein FtsA